MSTAPDPEIAAAAAPTASADAAAPNVAATGPVGSWLSPSIIIGAAITLATILVAVAAPLLAPFDPRDGDVNVANQPPWLFGGTFDHLLGTDPLGRDLLSRVMYGVRTSLAVGLTSVVIAVVIGLIVGLVAGYFGRFLDAVLMRFTDIQLGFPFIVLAVTVLSVSRPKFLTVVIVLSLAAWPIYARVVRSVMLGEKGSDYVVAGRAFGAPHRRIIFKYVGQPLFRPLSGIVTFDIANMIIFEAMLGFLAIGLQAPTISLGNILADGKSYLFSGYWWTVTMPGIVILIILLGINLLADGIQQRQARHG